MTSRLHLFEDAGFSARLHVVQDGLNPIRASLWTSNPHPFDPDAVDELSVDLWFNRLLEEIRALNLVTVISYSAPGYPGNTYQLDPK